jgi:hypothetical protein
MYINQEILMYINQHVRQSSRFDIMFARMVYVNGLRREHDVVIHICHDSYQIQRKSSEMHHCWDQT